VTRIYCCLPIYLKFFSLILISIVMVGCASSPRTKIELDSAQHQQKLAALQHWQIKGKFGFRSPKQKQSANLSWLQNSDDYQLSLSTILGTSILSLQGNPQWASLKADDETYNGASASELIWQMTGWTIPVEQLPTWIKGQSLKSDKVILSEQGWIEELQPTCINCRGWTLRFTDYQAVGNYWLPHKIKLTHKKNSVDVTIKINSWETN
jgi:outer membrane lipoprotein LolB